MFSRANHEQHERATNTPRTPNNRNGKVDNWLRFAKHRNRSLLKFTAT
jgi:hypothetical protein